MKVFRIDWNTGCINLYLDEFFPVPVSNAVKVFKLINRYCTDEQIKSLDEYLNQAKNESFDNGKIYAGIYRRWHQRAVETQEIIGSGKLPIGLKVPEWELEEYTKELKEAKKSERSALKSAKAQERKLKSLERNIELLHKYTRTQLKGGDS